MDNNYDSAFEKSWYELEKGLDAQEQRTREGLGYDRLFEEFKVWLERYNMMEFKYQNVQKVFNAIFDEIVMRHDFYHTVDGQYQTSKLGFLATARTSGNKLAIIGSYGGKAFTINTKSEVLHWV